VQTSQRYKTRRTFKARLLFVGYALRLLVGRLLTVGAVTLVGGAIFRWRAPALSTDFVDACYQVYAQLFFEHVADFPSDGVLRALYFIMPLIGAVVVAEGLLKLGASLMEFRNHREQWVRIMANTLSDHIIIVGLGNVGYRVLEELLSRDEDVVVIESAEQSAFLDEARDANVPVFTGDARRESLLEEAGIKRARAVIACTDDDLVNLEVCFDARKLQPHIRLVMRMFDQTLAQKIGDAFSLESSFSTSALAAPLFAAAALNARVHGAYRLGDTLMVTVEVPLDDRSSLKDRSVADIEETLGAPIVGITRRGRPPTHRFARTETVKAGDAVVCHVPSDELEALNGRVTAASLR
jgi:voltage-gated potassium channel